jgi:hypothetical protein
MALLRVVLAVATLAAAPAAFGGGDAGGDGSDPCAAIPVQARSIVRCRDGDRSCDMDGVCDGTCVVRACMTFQSRCVARGHACPRGYGSTTLDGDGGPWLVPVGATRTARLLATDVGAACKPARRRCVPPSLPPCTVTITGGVADGWSCRARLMATSPDRAFPDDYVIRLGELGGARYLDVVVHAGIPVAATWTSDAPDRHVQSIRVRTAADTFWADNYEVPRLGSLDATLALADVGVSKTAHHEAHGTFDATAVGVPSSDYASRVPFAVHAEF